MEGKGRIELPVLDSFDTNKVVGMLTLNMDALPPLPDWSLSLGYRETEGGGYVPYCLAIIPDDNLVAYLQQEKHRT